MELKTVFAEALWQDFQNAPCVVLALKTDDEVVGKPHQKTRPAHPGLDFGREPLIQYIVEIDIRQQGAGLAVDR